ncbi:endonuclease/exonuclease/phosphatase family protein [Rudanella lutea]|uniref:endonuclease/exonuclease/phosphatase family protein n=1 Tax=Rudanella lutea TaxID=451374 RepID=UPI0005C75A36|nr:endonuclease/exonuclease/phosphatase family protein [Rudanella lutea]
MTRCSLAFVVCLLVNLTAQSQSLTLMSYNIRHGLNTQNKSNLVRVGQLIREQRADIVGIQEIDSATTRSQGRNQVQILARATGLNAVFGRAVAEAQGGHGLAILSRHPIIASQTLPLPSPEPGASRVLLCAYVELPGGKTVRFCTAKLDPHSIQNRLAQAAAITALLKDSIQPVVWVGDLHGHTDDPVIRQMARYWRYAGVNNDGVTFPDLVSRFDYIMTRPNGEFGQTAYRIVEENVTSDHYPVLATFRLR